MITTLKIILKQKSIHWHKNWVSNWIRSTGADLMQWIVIESWCSYKLHLTVFAKPDDENCVWHKKSLYICTYYTGKIAAWTQMECRQMAFQLYMSIIWLKSVYTVYYIYTTVLPYWWVLAHGQKVDPSIGELVYRHTRRHLILWFFLKL